jgi:hypothetical protein
MTALTGEESLRLLSMEEWHGLGDDVNSAAVYLKNYGKDTPYKDQILQVDYEEITRLLSFSNDNLDNENRRIFTLVLVEQSLKFVRCVVDYLKQINSSGDVYDTGKVDARWGDMAMIEWHMHYLYWNISPSQKHCKHWEEPNIPIEPTPGKYYQHNPKWHNLTERITEEVI